MSDKESKEVEQARTETRIETKLDELMKQFTNHLHHHWAITIVLLGSTVTSILGLISVAVKVTFFA